MELKQKQTLFTILYVVLIVVVIFTCLFIMNYITGDGGSCLKDPITYYSEKTNQECYCYGGSDVFAPTDNNHLIIVP